MSEGSVFIGCPSYNGQIDSGAARSIYASASKTRQIFGMVNGKSLLSSNCNTLWCAALNAMEGHNIEWFAMLHADIEPDPWWVDELIAIAESEDCDMLSAVVPIKNEKGLTSTAIGELTEDCARFRLTQKQVHADGFPKTFDCYSALTHLSFLPGDLQVNEKFESPVLLLNTGCFVLRMRVPWRERVWFSNKDWIEQLPDGLWRANDFSEDWLFSKRVHQEGGRICATTAVRCVHKGVGLFDSHKIWGIENDLGHLITKEAS